MSTLTTSSSSPPLPSSMAAMLSMTTSTAGSGGAAGNTSNSCGTEVIGNVSPDTNGVISGPNAVCEQAEWDEMERLRPGAQSAVQFGIATEGLAERLARGTSGDPKPRVTRETAK